MALLLGFVGVLGFSFTLPATRLAVADLDPTFVGLGRAVLAALLGALLLGLLGGPRPTRAQLGRLLLVALGVVFGFPLLSAFALRDLTAAHSAVIVGLLPAATAVMAVLRVGERPSRGFWLASGAGLVAVLAFAASQGAGVPTSADLLVLGAVALGAVGYAEGATLARELGGWRVICWALLVSLPLTLPAAVLAAAQDGLRAGDDAWLGFAYVSLVSMFTAFFAWYAGLARGGVAKIGQIQLAQPVLTLGWSAALLSEHVGAATIAASGAVLASVVATQRSQVHRAPAVPRPGAQRYPLDACPHMSDTGRTCRSLPPRAGAPYAG
jgi:drug/metabolite transporter (DMT)-like permease